MEDLHKSIVNQRLDEHDRIQHNIDKIQGVKIIVHGKTIYRDMNALYCLSVNNPVRKSLIQLIEWKWFDYFIMFLISINSVLLGIRDYEDRI
jgi:hypothetical protein